MRRIFETSLNFSQACLGVHGAEAGQEEPDPETAQEQELPADQEGLPVTREQDPEERHRGHHLGERQILREAPGEPVGVHVREPRPHQDAHPGPEQAEG